MRDFHNTPATNTFAPPMGRAIIISILALLQWLPGARGEKGRLHHALESNIGKEEFLFWGDGPLQDTTIRPGTVSALPDSARWEGPGPASPQAREVVPDSAWANIDTTAVDRPPVDLNAFIPVPAGGDLLPDSTRQPTPAGLSGQPYGYRVYAFIAAHPYFKAAETSLKLPSLVRNPPSMEWIFYLFTGMLFYLALLRLAFPKYFHDLFRVFFNSSLRQKQIREQLIQEPLPSLLLNLFFVVSGGLFLFFVLGHKGLAAAYAKWMVLGACILLLAVIYLVKFMTMKAFGWIFGKGEVVETYLFVVFMVNKMAGMVLLPFSVFLAYASGEESTTLTFLALLALGILGLYRLVRGFSAIHKTFRINQLQFILLVAALEVVPILLLYKGLNTLF